MCLAQSSGKFFKLCLFQLGDADHRFGTQDMASPVLVDLTVSVIVVDPDRLPQLSQKAFVFGVNLGEGNSGAGLPVDQMLQPGLPCDEPVRDLNLVTQGRQEHNQFKTQHVQSPLAESCCSPPGW